MPTRAEAIPSGGPLLGFPVEALGHALDHEVWGVRALWSEAVGPF